MKYFAILIIIVLLLDKLNIFKSLSFNKDKDDPDSLPENFPYKKVNYFFTKNELNFYNVLKNITNEMNLTLFSKVRLADIIYLEKINKSNIKYWNMIKSKHLDFLICDSKYFKPLLAIELDDTSHNKKDRIDRDNFINNALDSVKLPLYRMKVSDNYNSSDLKDIIMIYVKYNLQSLS